MRQIAHSQIQLLSFELFQTDVAGDDLKDDCNKVFIHCYDIDCFIIIIIHFIFRLNGLLHRK